MKVFLIMFGIFSFNAIHAHTQEINTFPDSCDFTLSIEVLDSDSDRRVSFISDLIGQDMNLNKQSDSGIVIFENLCKGEFEVIIKSDGYITDTLAFSLTESRKLKAQLIRRTYEIDKIEIVDEAVISDDQPVGILQGTEFEKTTGESLALSLSKLTGVSSLNTGSSISKPMIHGFSGNRILILNNGVRLEGQQWGSEHAPEIDPLIGRELSVIKGASTVRYGQDAIGGVVLVSPGALPYGNLLNGEIDLVGFSNGLEGVASAVLESGISGAPNFAYRLQGTLKKSGNIHTPDYTLLNTGYEEANFSAGLGFRSDEVELSGFFSTFNSKIGIYSGSHIGNLTDLENAINSKVPADTGSFSYQISRPYQDVNHNFLKLEATYPASNKLILSADLGFQRNIRQEYDSHGSEGSEPDLYFSLDSYTLDLVGDVQYDNPMSAAIGISGISQTNIGKGRPLIPNFENRSVGAFYIHKYTNDGYQIEAGLRYDYEWIRTYEYENNVVVSRAHDYNNISGKAGASFRLWKGTELSLYAGTAWRPPSVNELYSDGLHHGTASYEIGNPNLLSEYGLNFTGTLRYDNSRNLSIEASAYTNLMQNYIYLEPRPPATLTIRGAFPTFYYEQGDSYINGIDFDLAYEPYPFIEFNSKISIVRAFNKSLNDYIPLIPPDRFENSLTLRTNETGAFTDLFGTFSVVSVMEQTRVPSNSDYLSPPPAYNIFDLYAGATINVFGSEFRSMLVINNLFDTRYRDYLNRFRYYTDEMGRNISLKIIVPFGSKN